MSCCSQSLLPHSNSHLHTKIRTDLEVPLGFYVESIIEQISLRTVAHRNQHPYAMFKASIKLLALKLGFINL